MVQSRYKKILLIAVLFALILSLFTACLPGTLATTDIGKAGFLLGVWHGWMAPVSLIIGLFDPMVRIYERNNVGWWYDFGFYIAIISGFGGISLARRRPGGRNHR